MDMINEFLQYIQYEKNYSSHTVLSYHTDLTQFCEFCNTSTDNFSPEKTDPQAIQHWILSLMSSKTSSRTLSRKISTLKSLWRFLLARGYAVQNPTLKIIIPKTNKPIPAFFKDSEMEIILKDVSTLNEFTPTRDQLILSLFYQTGIRLSELINILNSDIDLTEGTIRIIGKRNKQRIIPIGIKLCNQIENYIALRDNKIEKIDNHLFVKQNGKTLYAKLVYNLVHKTMTQVSSLHKRSPHVLRHTFATGMLNGGADINAVKELLGHSSLAATQVYTHSSFDELNNIYKHAHPRAK